MAISEKNNPSKTHSNTRNKKQNDGLTTRSGDLPAGFDSDVYLQINKDVADAGITDGAQHYLEYGRSELRTLLPENTGLKHPESRMLSSNQRTRWIEELAEMSEQTPLDEIVENHPRAAWLWSGFTLSGYLSEHGDIAAAIEDPLFAAFHFLEIGLEEARKAHSDDWDAEYIEKRYGLSFDPDGTEVVQVLSGLLAQGHDPLEIALTEAQQWELSGLYGTELCKMFDHEHYHAMANHDGMPPADFDRPTCIAHFINHGIAATRSINPEAEFDATFYSNEIDDTLLTSLLQDHSEEELENFQNGDTSEQIKSKLYRHWLSRGLRLGLTPNLKAWAKKYHAIDVPSEIIDQLPLYRVAAKLPSEATQREVLDQLLLDPRAGLAAIDITPDAAAEFTVAMADRFAITDRQDQAEWLYWQILNQAQNNNRAKRHLSDLLQRKGRSDIAQILRKQVPQSQDSGWNTLALAELELDNNRVHEAANRLFDFPVEFLKDISIAKKKSELSNRLFHTIWGNLNGYLDLFGISETQNIIRKALSACTPEFSSTERSHVIKRVALIGNEDLYQCKLYRVDQKADQLSAAGYDVTIISPSHGLAEFKRDLSNFDAAIFFRVPAFPPIIDAIISANQNGVTTFYEIDDVVFDTEHFPPSFESYAGTIDKQHYAQMACGVPLFEHAMGLCDYGIASTATISELMKEKVRTGKVIEHHNALGKLHMTAIRENAGSRTEPGEDRPLVIFYGSGTKAHKEDFHDILEPALAEIVKRYPGKVEIRLVGYFGTFKHLDMESDPVTIIEPVWDFEDFCAMVAKADINLSVLTDSLLTDAKSEIKWMEAGMFGTPSVVSATATHRETIEDRVTGFLCRTTQDFTNALDMLVSDAGLRKQIGEAAREVILSRYSIESMGQNLRDAFHDIRPGQSDTTRVLVVNVFYPPQAIGGATRVVHDNVKLIHENYKDRFEVEVVCTLEGGHTPLDVTTYGHEGVRVHAITAPSMENGDMTAADARLSTVFESLLDKIQPDIVHFHCIQRLTSSVVNTVRYRNIPYFITLHDSWWISPNQFVIDENGVAEYYDYAKQDQPDFPDRARALARPLKSASGLLAVSEKFAELHRACNLKNVITVENGVSPLKALPKQPSSTGRVRLAHIGGASRHKGIHHVRNALSANDYSNLELLLIDHAMPSGSERHEVWGTTPVTIKGKVPQSEVSSLYAQIDILLAPSIWPESYGLVTREAMTCGTWVIASDQGAIGADVKEGVNGHLVDVSTYEGLANCLWQVNDNAEKYLESPQEIPQLRSVNEQVEDLVKIYNGILK
ncbi:glycosyltransferase [Roseovarius sp. MMSF_3281]|uniref:glycosyltransferase n=1 Tax=Roseovarius sp. MMSF_3281 TaxID=3046694 RepID=UPI00273EC389|nr:glycosyltransferase [Roseovarius sp. MMSF_3281]